VVEEDRATRLRRAEAWARENVHLFSAGFHGKSSVTSVAQITAQGQMFEQRARGEVRRRDSLRQRATDAVVRDYVDWIERTDG
jgi:hypothetical protein